MQPIWLQWVLIQKDLLAKYLVVFTVNRQLYVNIIKPLGSSQTINVDFPSLQQRHLHKSILNQIRLSDN